MAAYDPVTVTIDADEMIYVDHLGLEHTVTAGETWVFSMTARGASETVIRVVSGSMSLETGETLTVVNDPAFSEFTLVSDGGTPTTSGRLSFRENWNSNYLNLYDISSMQINSLTEPTNMTFTITSRERPMRRIQVQTITLSQ